MRRLILASTMFLSGCFETFVPVKPPEFPVAPQILLERCPQLNKTDPDKGTLRDMLHTVIENYSLYYQCSAKTQGWQNWYNEQRRVYKESLK